MDPITHGVVGLSIAVLAGEPAAVSNPAIIGCVLGAIIPDGDIIMQLKGDYAYLKNHRGASHSILMMIVYAGLITGFLSLIIGNFEFWKVFLITLAGCFSHIALDITNSYGAKVLWPLFKKNITLDLLLVYDPMLIIVCMTIIIPYVRSIIPSYIAIFIFAYYIILRLFMKRLARNIAFENMSGKYKIVGFRIMPSMVGLIKWHFIISTEKEKVIGEVNIFPRRFRIIDIKENIDAVLYEIVEGTRIAVFFRQFTPIFHIDCKKKDDNYIFEFIDLRYYIARDFLHHATAVINIDLIVVTSLFHPYTRSRNVEV